MNQTPTDQKLPEFERIHVGDCRRVLAGWPENVFDAEVTDPPYEFGFMGKSWDSSGVAYDVETWRQTYRVLKPGAHLLAFGGTRTYHRMVCAIEDAGFEIRDQLQWIYGSGFPKSLDVSKSIDKSAGAVRAIAKEGRRRKKGIRGGRLLGGDGKPHTSVTTIPRTAAAQLWSGWGTGLKPAHEPICLARKPLSEKNIAANVLRWGTGALNIDASRIPVSATDARDVGRVITRSLKEDRSGWGMETKAAMTGPVVKPEGRWPANVLFDERAAAQLDAQAGEIPTGGAPKRRNSDKFRSVYGAFHGQSELETPRAPDTGGASRFYYVAKPDRDERDGNLKDAGERNDHPTVKPTKLIQYLMRLVLPRGGVLLDQFIGSGTTAIACRGLGERWVGVELLPEHAKQAEGRISGELF